MTIQDDHWLKPFIRSLPVERLREMVFELACTEEAVRTRLQHERSQGVNSDQIQLSAHFQRLLERLLNVRAYFNAWDSASN